MFHLNHVKATMKVLIIWLSFLIVLCLNQAISQSMNDADKATINQFEIESSHIQRILSQDVIDGSVMSIINNYINEAFLVAYSAAMNIDVSYETELNSTVVKNGNECQKEVNNAMMRALKGSRYHFQDLWIEFDSAIVGYDRYISHYLTLILKENSQEREIVSDCFKSWYGDWENFETCVKDTWKTLSDDEQKATVRLSVYLGRVQERGETLQNKTINDLTQYAEDNYSSYLNFVDQMQNCTLQL